MMINLLYQNFVHLIVSDLCKPVEKYLHGELTPLMKRCHFSARSQRSRSSGGGPHSLLFVSSSWLLDVRVRLHLCLRFSHWNVRVLSVSWEKMVLDTGNLSNVRACHADICDEHRD